MSHDFQDDNAHDPTAKSPRWRNKVRMDQTVGVDYLAYRNRTYERCTPATKRLWDHVLFLESLSVSIITRLLSTMSPEDRAKHRGLVEQAQRYVNINARQYATDEENLP